MSEIHLTLPSIAAHNWLKEHSHGVVWIRPDGLRARCMGPPSYGYKGCAQCGYEQMIVGLLMELGVIDGNARGPESNITSYAEIEDVGGHPRLP